MKYFILTLFSFLILSCSSEPNSQSKIEIAGMTCAEGCAKTIQAKLNKTSGIAEASVDFEKETAQISFDSTKISQKEIIETIEEVGDYKAKPVK